ncbi:MFS transporter [Rhizobium calliandrae]|uniref:MFS transporter n=1 Tax=Rhizobium calliandrae TaxID=1312182 RepID=A0ABT7KPY3_9HYPH|nr:MFS transporter [Rhizobium calliandrae]MDL2410694.1 MFS transporter [Rhizobium calliandrae]
MTKNFPPGAMFALIACGTVLGIAGTDLVLPAVPSLPQSLGGTTALAQLVLAAYALGTLIGLIAFGELGARFDPRKLLVWSLGLFTLTSFLAVLAPSIEWLIVLRLAQGAFGSGPAVFAPGFISSSHSHDKAASALGRLGSIESLTPALAPIAGAYLLALGGWQISFALLGSLGLAAALVTGRYVASFPGRDRAPAPHQSYLTIIRDRAFLRYALSQAFSLGSILVFVFGAPAVLTGPLGKGIQYFVVLQVLGIAMFITGANLSSSLATRFGTGRVIAAGTFILTLAFVFILVYAAAGGVNITVLVALWIIVNLGFGTRGPVGFHQAIIASHGDHSRGAALIIASILGTAAIGTATTAPFISMGLWPLAFASTAIAFLGLFSFVALGPSTSRWHR